MIKDQNIQRLEDNEVLKINKQVGFLQKKNPIRGAVIVEKLEFINKQNSVVIKYWFTYLLIFSCKNRKSTLKTPITTAAEEKFCKIFPNFRKK